MEETKYSGKFIKVTEEEIHGDIWERAYLADGVQVFPITPDKKIYMIEERRPHEKKAIRLKFVTGLMDKPDENPLETANREMQEEIGMSAKSLQVINHTQLSGTINNNFYQVIATQLTDDKIPNPDGEDTIVSIKAYSFSEIHQMLESNILKWDMGTLAFLKIEKLLKNNQLTL
jgi:8-oxo-dGTP pyrophosphatase MutT (NUDIX family)